MRKFFFDSDSLVVYEISPMPFWFASIALSLSVFALALTVISLVLHWIKRAEPPEITGVLTRIQELQTQHLDLLDKVEHWRKRDNVRRARQGAEDKLNAAPDPSTPAEYKSQLRAKATAAGMGI